MKLTDEDKDFLKAPRKWIAMQPEVTGEKDPTRKRIIATFAWIDRMLKIDKQILDSPKKVMLFMLKYKIDGELTRSR